MQQFSTEDFTGRDLPYDHAPKKAGITFFLGFVREPEARSSRHPTIEEAFECP